SHASESAPETIDEQSALAARARERRPSSFQIALERASRRTAERNQTLLVALAHHAHQSPLQVHGLERQAGQLGGPQAARVGELEQGPVPETERLFSQGLRQEPLDVRKRQRARQAPPGSQRLEV